jgi:hypothetical protein
MQALLDDSAMTEWASFPIRLLRDVSDKDC